MHSRRTSPLRGSLRAGCVMLLGALPALACADIAVTVLDADGAPVGDVAVYAVPRTTAATGSAGPAAAVMDQADSAFVPHLLVVEAGTYIEFPNNDTVSHHVYSFSDAKRFELPLYKGNLHPPLRFDTPGVVVLGCNIHDGMLGYILVVDTPWFTVTNAAGEARLPALPDGDYAVHVWTPRARAGDLPRPRQTNVSDGSARELRFRFEGKLMPAHEDRHGRSTLTWDRY
ncbi:MAG: methylamine utilization protein [Gammaproteobacteria bacterium]|nr:methylamine utilization protein [Gammaproteobacteria bacterium]